jgi:hypothetical protein
MPTSTCLLMKRPQVLDRPEWTGRLRVERRDTGPGMAQEDVTAVRTTIDIAALRAYRTAVGQATRAAIADLAPEWWIQSITPADVNHLIASGAFIPAVVPLVRRAVRRYGGMLGSIEITHNALHLGEAQTVRSLLERRAGPLAPFVYPDFTRESVLNRFDTRPHEAGVVRRAWRGVVTAAFNPEDRPVGARCPSGSRCQCAQYAPEQIR